MTKYASAHHPRTAQRVPSAYGPDPANPGDHRHPQAQPSLPFSSRTFSLSIGKVRAACACSRRCLRNTCAKRTIHRSGKRRKEVRARSVCVREVERVGSHCLRTSPSACRCTASSTAATGEGAPQPHEAVGGITEPRLRAARAPTRHLWRARLLLRGSTFLPRNAWSVRGPTTSRACGASPLNLTLKVATRDRFVFKFCTGKI